jgi:BASS family bile acid:Na+ symporter
MNRLLTASVQAFPLWVVGAGALALIVPESLAWFATTRWLGQSLIVWSLALIMLGMGLTLTVDDFRQAFRMPRTALLGLTAQFTIMPLAGWSVATALDLPTPFAVGLILTGCCPGGTASNIVTYLARGHVALSVLMTLLSTLAALALTPLLTGALAGHLVPVDRAALFLDTLKVVVAPVALGVLLNQRAPRLVRAIAPAAPLAAALAVALICGSIVAVHAPVIRAQFTEIALAVGLLHLTGFGLGYAAAHAAGCAPAIARTVSIEVGMQNSGLAVVLARGNFADPLTAVPGAISSVFHSVIGSVLAAWWRYRSGPKAPS